MTIRWYGLVAPEEAATGDRRMFAGNGLTNRDFPLPAAWQRVSGSGHQGSVVVASWDRRYHGDGGVWGAGEFLDPGIVPEVTEAIYLLEKRLIGPSVDLDPDFAYEVVPHPDRPDEFAMKVTRGNVHGVTFVMGPAFPQVHITVDTEEEMSILASAGITSATFATSGVNSASWRKFPLAPRETAFDADTAIDRIAAWSGGDAGKFSSAFLWKDPQGNPLNRETYRLPVVDILDSKAYLIPRAVFSAGVIMSGGHGGLYDTLDQAERLKVQEVITDMYDMLRQEYSDPRVTAPWQKGGREGARNEEDTPTRVASAEFDGDDSTCPEGQHLMPDGTCMDDEDMPAEEYQMIIDLATASPEFQSRLGGELEEYWVRGEGAAKIRWGTEGSFDRCVRALRDKFPKDTEGLCANLHHEATGKWPAEGKRRGEHAFGDMDDVSVFPWSKNAGTAIGNSIGAVHEHGDFAVDASIDENGQVCHCRTSTASSAPKLSSRDAVSGMKSDAIHVRTAETSTFAANGHATDVNTIQASLNHRTKPSDPGVENRKDAGANALPTGGQNSEFQNFNGSTLQKYIGDNKVDAAFVSSLSNSDLENWGRFGLHTSTTVTAPDVFGDSSARPAIGVSGPSSTIPILSNGQPNTFASGATVSTFRKSNSLSATTKGVGLLKPPNAWFQNPNLKRATPLIVTEDGRVFGTLASWRQCHMGVGNRCVIAPHSRTNYQFFKQGSVLTSDGGTVRVGKITLGTGHADKSFGVVPAVEHYDHTGTCVAVVNAGEDSFGVWVAGALVDGVSEADAATLRRSPLSGDWRRVDGNLELVAALAVNSPGFPVLHEDVEGSYSLTAAGVLEPDGGVAEPPVAREPFNPGAFAEVDAFLADLARNDKIAKIGRAFQDLLPPQEGCDCHL